MGRRTPEIKYDRGTLIIHPPPQGQAWLNYVEWDDRIEKFRARAQDYPAIVQLLQREQIAFNDQARNFFPLELGQTLTMEPYPHQHQALIAWKKAQRRGVIVLPTGAGKTYVAQMAIASTPRTSLIVVPTLDLMHQWYAQLLKSFPGVDIGLLGGGSRDRSPILVATYASAAIHAETLGNHYALLIFDECHHLPTDFHRVIAEYSIAPYRLGLTATPERSDDKHGELNLLIGPEVYRQNPDSLSGHTLARHEVKQILVQLSPAEQAAYDDAIAVRNQFLRQANINLGGINGWQRFVQMSAQTPEGRQAMLAHRQSKEIANCTTGKLKVLTDIIQDHRDERILIFTNDNATVYQISQDFLIPALTHQTPVKERHQILELFKLGDYQTLVTSHVLNEGVDVPDAAIAVILSGTGSPREFIQRLGRILRKGKTDQKVALLYEVVTADTAEERTSQRRKGETHPIPFKPKQGQLELLTYSDDGIKIPRAAEESNDDYG